MTVNEPYIRGLNLLCLPEFIESIGGDADALFKAHGFLIDEIAKFESLVSFRKSAELMENAARQFNKPFFSLEWALALPPHLPNAAPFLLLAKFEKELRGWLHSAVRYLPFYTNAFSVEYTEHRNEKQAAVRYIADPITLLSRHHTEAAMSLMVIVVRKICGRLDLNPDIVRFQHKKINGGEIFYEKVFGCPIEFGASVTEFVFDKAHLSLRIGGNMAFLKTLIGLYVRAQIESLKTYKSSTAQMVWLAISSTLGTGSCNIETIADSFGFNVKQLQRLLADEGTSFSTILEKVRKNAAKSFLLQSRIPISGIAGMLGYAGTPPFTLAFRRWTGQSPNEFRKRSLAKDVVDWINQP